MADARLETEDQVSSAESTPAGRVRATRRSIGAPRVQRDAPAATRAERRPPSREELDARQDAMRETRRPTKPGEIARAEKNPRTISVPDVGPTDSGKPRK